MIVNNNNKISKINLSPSRLQTRMETIIWVMGEIIIMEIFIRISINNSLRRGREDHQSVKIVLE